MSEPNPFDDPFDDDLAAMFREAAEAVPDDGFTDRVVARVRRRAEARNVALAAAAGLGAIVAGTQIVPAWRMVRTGARSLIGGVEAEGAAALSNSPALSGTDWSAVATSPVTLAVVTAAALAAAWAASAASSAAR